LEKKNHSFFPLEPSASIEPYFTMIYFHFINRLFKPINTLGEGKLYKILIACVANDSG